MSLSKQAVVGLLLGSQHGWSLKTPDEHVQMDEYTYPILPSEKNALEQQRQTRKQWPASSGSSAAASSSSSAAEVEQSVTFSANSRRKSKAVSRASHPFVKRLMGDESVTVIATNSSMLESGIPDWAQISFWSSLSPAYSPSPITTTTTAPPALHSHFSHRSADHPHIHWQEDEWSNFAHASLLQELNNNFNFPKKILNFLLLREMPK